MLTEVKAQNRPVTREGLSGIRVKTAGLGRRVQDSSYYLGIVRSKISELDSEIKKMKKEINQSKKDNSKYVRLEKKYEDLIKEVRELEGTLADYNLAMDKARTNTDPYEITRYQEVLRERNKALEQEVDVIFLQRQKEESRVRKIEAKIAEIRKSVDRRIEMLAPEKLQKYKQFAEEDFVLSRNIDKMSQHIDSMKSNLTKLENRVRHDTWRGEFSNLERRLEDRKEELEMLEQEFEAMSLDPQAAREYLLKRVRYFSESIKETEKKIKEAERENENNSQMLQDLTVDIEEREGKTQDSKKYEVLFQRDKEMTEFLERYPAMRKEQLEDQEKTKQMIVALLEHISTDLNRQTNIPTKESVEDMKNDLSFKKRQVNASQNTQQRLEQELHKRTEDLKKIDKIGEKIEKEFSTLTSRMTKMSDSMSSLENIEQLRYEAQDTATKLRSLIKSYEERRDTVRQQLPLINRELDGISASLECETNGNLKAQEARIRVNEQNIFKLNEFIRKRSQESNYKDLKKKCMNLVNEINQTVIRNHRESMESLIGPGYSTK